MKHLKIIAFTHKDIELQELGKLILPEQDIEEKLGGIKKRFNISEIFYVGTCNRVEFIFVLPHHTDSNFVNELIHELKFANLCPHSRNSLVSKSVVYEGDVALEHLLRTSCSLESLVVGEKEILAQIRNAYERCKNVGLTGDYLRLVMNRVVKTAKEVYTQTDIAKNPISVVSLAYRQLRQLKAFENSRILLIGAGETNQNFAQYLQKYQFSNFFVFNRTLEKAQKLANSLKGKAYPLSELKNFKQGFDILITCTSATKPIITQELYEHLLNGETTKKIIVDLAVPTDTHKKVIENFKLDFIQVQDLEKEADINKQKRKLEVNKADDIIQQNVDEFSSILKQRRIEIAMEQVPQTVKIIRKNALEVVFAHEVNGLNNHEKKLLNKVLDYVEKKYISIPMIMAKDILLNEAVSQHSISRNYETINDTTCPFTD